MKSISTTGEYRIANVDQIRLLQSTVRQDILDSLMASGSATIADLAAALGLPADALYYHIRKLVAAGLVQPEGTDDQARGATRYVLPAERMRLEYDLEPEGRAAVADVISAALRSAARDFSAALEGGEAETRGANRNLLGGRVRGWLAPEDVREVNGLLERIWEIFRESRRGANRSLMSFSCALSPMEARPPRR